MSAELVLTPEQEILKRTAADFVAKHSPIARVRRLRDAGDPLGYSPELWKQMAELGWPGIVIPEQYGGLGLGYADLVVVLEELGTVLAPEPFLGSVLLGANAILLGGATSLPESLLPQVAACELVLAFAHHEPRVRHRLERVAARAQKAGSGFRLDGEKDLVLDGVGADRLIVSARLSGGVSDRDGIALFLVDARSPGVEVTRQYLLDGRGAALVRLRGVEVAEADRLDVAMRGADLIDAIVDRALVGLAAEMLGGMRQAFETTIAYLKDREQFGVKIGTFQALKHRAARMFVEVELGRSVVMAAARAIDSGAADAGKLAALAKAKLSDAFVSVANEAVQMHGGIGMTDEHDIGFYLKRARAAEATLGDASFHRDRYASLEGY